MIWNPFKYFRKSKVALAHEKEWQTFNNEIQPDKIEAFVIDFLGKQYRARTIWPMEMLWWSKHGIPGNNTAMLASIEAFKEACYSLEHQGKIIRVGEEMWVIKQ